VGLLLAAERITKRYAVNDVVANDGAILHVEAGTIHAVVGENGAGKSTLMHVIAGAIAQDAGTVTVNGNVLPPGDPVASLRSGVVMSFQHPRLARSLTVLDNLILGREPVGRLGRLDRERATTEIRAVAPSLTPAMLDRAVFTLSSGQTRLISIVAALLRLPAGHGGLLILDEPTEACTPGEVVEIYDLMRGVAAGGHGVIFITHKLREVGEVADSVTVLRHGRTVAERSGLLRPKTIAKLMSPGPESVTIDWDRSLTHIGEKQSAAPSAALELRQVTAIDRGHTRLDGVSFSVGPGEIVGLVGVRQNGVEAMEDLLAGSLHPVHGTVAIGGRVVARVYPGYLRHPGVRYVPTARLVRGASIHSSVAENMIALKRRALRRRGVLSAERVLSFAGETASQFGIECRPKSSLATLSGGTIQKVILSRELEGLPPVAVVCEPGWGLDVRSREAVFATIRRAAEQGTAVVLLSTDIDEVLRLATRIGVFYGGRLIAMRATDEITRPELGRLTAGVVAGDGDA
jgi:ABC-type uncharacterized transport system ATPase subunit